MARGVMLDRFAIWQTHMANLRELYGSLMARTNERTNATNERFQDTGITPHLLNAAGAVDKGISRRGFVQAVA